MDNTNETGEFLPLPYFPWDRRPTHVPIDVDEAATALYLSRDAHDGPIAAAAARLKCEPLRLERAIKRSPRLTRLHAELVALLNDRTHGEINRAFASDDDRRREWASAKVMNSEQFRSHPLAPASDRGGSLTINQDNREIVFRWQSAPALDAPVQSVDTAPHETDQQTSEAAD